MALRSIGHVFACSSNQCSTRSYSSAGSISAGAISTAADRHQHEQMQGVGLERQREIEHRRQLGDVVPGDRRVDLDRDTLLPQRADAR